MAANVEQMEVVFNDLLKSFESAAQSREWSNGVAGNEYTRNVAIVKQQKEAFAKRFAVAKKGE